MSFVTVKVVSQSVWMQVALGVLALFASAQIHVPLFPVPATFQTAVVLAIGLLMSHRLAVSTVLAYVGLGLLGAPVFAGFAFGPAILLGPRGGYLVGMVLAAFFVSYIRETYALKSLFSFFVLSVFGDILIFACGISWLSTLLGLKQALSYGLLPFLGPEGVKLLGLFCGLKYERRQRSR